MTHCRTCLSVPCECPHPKHCICARCCPREPWARLEPPAPVQPAPAAFCSALEVEDDGPARISPLTWVARAALVWLLAFVLGAAMCSCTRAHTPLEDRALSAVLDAWADAGLPEPRASCRVDSFRIEAPTTLDRFRRACSGPGQPPELVRAWSCLRWRYEPRVRTLVYPAAVLSPELPEARGAAMAAHELAHALSLCALGTADAEHLDPRVWEGPPGRRNPDSVETRAEMELYGTAERPPVEP